MNLGTRPLSPLYSTNFMFDCTLSTSHFLVPLATFGGGGAVLKLLNVCSRNLSVFAAGILRDLGWGGDQLFL